MNRGGGSLDGFEAGANFPKTSGCAFDLRVERR
jgi:hypothetical protein